MTSGLALMIVGAPKSGSTALFHYLADHPDLRGHVHREMPFFGRDDEFEQGWDLALQKYFPPDRERAFLIGKHTMAMYHRTALERIIQSTPAVVVAVLRDPVARAYSHFHYARLRGWEDATSFEEGLAREAHRCSSEPPQARDMQYVGDGVYAPRVRDLLDVVPADRRRIYLQEDLRREPQRVCSELFALAGLPPHEADVSKRHNEGRAPRSARFARAFLAIQQPGSPLRTVASRTLPSRTLYRARFFVNRLNEASASTPPMADDTRAMLAGRFAGPNAELADVLGRPLPEWSA